MPSRWFKAVGPGKDELHGYGRPKSQTPDHIGCVRPKSQTPDYTGCVADGPLYIAHRYE